MRFIQTADGEDMEEGVHNWNLLPLLTWSIRSKWKETFLSDIGYCLTRISWPVDSIWSLWFIHCALNRAIKHKLETDLVIKKIPKIRHVNWLCIIIWFRIFTKVRMEIGMYGEEKRMLTNKRRQTNRKNTLLQTISLQNWLRVSNVAHAQYILPFASYRLLTQNNCSTLNRSKRQFFNI